MAGQLLESGLRRHRSTGMLPSVALHTLLILLAIRATARATNVPVDMTLHQQRVAYVAPRPQQLRGSPAPRRASTGGIALPPALIMTPLDIPDHLPPAPTGDAMTDAITAWDARPDGNGSSGPVTTGGRGDVYTARDVDRAAAPIRLAAPQYPDFLRAAGVQGQVVVQFAIDTAGRVIPASIAILRSDHPQFSTSVRRALTAAAFVPAEAGGHPVVELVQQSFGFVIR